jgi:hypothetical protein
MGEKRRNWAMWSGFLLALGAVLCNIILFVNLPGRHAVPWVSLLLATIALILVVRGLLLVFGQPWLDAALFQLERNGALLRVHAVVCSKVLDTADIVRDAWLQHLC